MGTHTYLYGSVVPLTATANTGSTFVGWSGGASGTSNSTTVTLDGNKTVAATFALNTYTLAVATEGDGSGVVTPTIGTHTYPYGSVVPLTATANTGSIFIGWSGGASGTSNSTTVTLDGNKTVTATFALLPLSSYVLTVNKAGNGTGAVTSISAGIDCGITCTANFTSGSVVTLTATSALGSSFTGWSGGGCAGTGVCAVTMTATQSVTATFSRYWIHLPLVTHNFPGKNLLVSDIITSTGPTNVRVVIQNTGEQPITEDFWVIIYLDPTGTVQINKFWWEVGGCTMCGTAWLITETIQPGQSVTLVPVDAHPTYKPYWPSSFGSGQHRVWAQVDAWADSGTTGLVQEGNEGDNIRGPVTFTVP